MSNEAQSNLFPLTCADSGHDYEMAGDGYYKRNSSEEEPVDKRVYRMVFCVRCLDNREICVKDPRPVETEVKTTKTRSRKARR